MGLDLMQVNLQLTRMDARPPFADLSKRKPYWDTAEFRQDIEREFGFTIPELRKLIREANRA